MLSLCLIFPVLTSSGSEPEAGAPKPRRFQVGAATSNITPRLGISINGHFSDRKAAHVHDELHARCLVLDDGTNRLALVVCDSCMIPREVTDEAKAQIAKRVGLPPERVLISATHTHTAPTCAGVFQSAPDPDYQEFLVHRITDGVARAVRNLSPAQIGWGKGNEPNQVFNRRWRMKPGSVGQNPFGGTNDQVRMNPPIESPDLVEPAGPIDPEIALVALRSPEGRPIALLANYSLHYVGTGRDGDEISADYYGLFANQIMRLLGAEHQDPPFVAILANGTSGDINNINFRKKRDPRAPYEQANLVAEAIAAEVHRVCQNLVYRDWVSLGSRHAEISLGVRRPDTKELARARSILAAASGRALRSPEEVYAHETVLLHEYPPSVPLVLQAIRIGDLGIAAIPCEVFVETGLAIKKESPFAQTFTIELANGYNGYLPTPEHHRLGGYETWRARSSYLETEAEPKVIKTLQELFALLEPEIAEK